MKKLILTVICLLLSLYSCKPTLTNQKINKKREGLWIEKHSLDTSKYNSIGKYRNDDPVKKWRYYLNDKIIKTEKYKKNDCIIKFYHQNGKIQSQGKTKLDLSDKYMHWYYSGNWNFYNEKGKLIMKRNYNKGKLISETILK